MLWLGKGWREWRNSCGRLLIYARAELAAFGAPRGGLGRRVWEGPPSVALGPPGSMGDSMETIEERATQRGGARARNRGLGDGPFMRPADKRAAAATALQACRWPQVTRPYTQVGLRGRTESKYSRCSEWAAMRPGERRQAGAAGGRAGIHKREQSTGHPWHQTERGWTESISKEVRYSFQEEGKGNGPVRHTRPSCSSGRRHNSRGQGKTLCAAGGTQDY